MAGKCKLCASPFRDAIEDRLLQGESIHLLSEWLKTQGESISAPSIQRHKVNHFAPTRHENDFIGVTPYETNRNVAQSEIEPFIDTDAAMSKIMTELEDTDVFASVINERKMTQLLLEKIMQKQLIIVHELQTQYVAGKAGYPDSQIRGLKTIIDMTNSLPTYQNKGLLHEIRRDNTKQYNEKIVESAKEVAAIEGAKYVDWYVLKNDVYISTPMDEIRGLAKKLHPHDLERQLEWEKEKFAKWDSILYGHLPCDWEYEMKISRAIDYHVDDYYAEHDHELVDKKRREIINFVIETYKTPDNAHDELKVISEYACEYMTCLDKIRAVVA